MTIRNIGASAIKLTTLKIAMILSICIANAQYPVLKLDKSNAVSCSVSQETKYSTDKNAVYAREYLWYASSHREVFTNSDIEKVDGNDTTRRTYEIFLHNRYYSFSTVDEFPDFIDNGIVGLEGKLPDRRPTPLQISYTVPFDGGLQLWEEIMPLSLKTSGQNVAFNRKFSGQDCKVQIFFTNSTQKVLQKVIIKSSLTPYSYEAEIKEFQLLNGIELPKLVSIEIHKPISDSKVIIETSQVRYSNYKLSKIDPALEALEPKKSMILGSFAGNKIYEYLGNGELKFLRDKGMQKAPAIAATNFIAITALCVASLTGLAAVVLQRKKKRT